MFSWVTQDSNRSISNCYSDRGTFTVWMSDNKGNKWKEDNYEGYGVFGGKDYYQLVAEMNGKSDREEGIDIAYSGKNYLSPNLSESEDWKWIEENPESCDRQGFFYDDDSEDEEYEEDEN